MQPLGTDLPNPQKFLDTFDGHFDKDYIWHKYPATRRTKLEDEWLIDRLGKANARRREYLKYCEGTAKNLLMSKATQRRQGN